MQNLKQRFSYRKFAKPPYRILYLDDDYFLQRETIDALNRLGHEVTAVRVVRDPKQMLERILKTAVMIQPDCVMTNNHAGIDEAGKIVNILNEIGLPLVSWFLDDFRFIMFEPAAQATPNCVIFTFDSQHVQPLRDCGFSHVHYLPSASAVDPHTDYTYSEFEALQNATVFIGSTFNKSKAERFHPDYPPLVKQLSQKIDFTTLQHNLIDQSYQLQGNAFEDTAKFYSYAGYMICEATEKYRRFWLENVKAQNFHVFGDKDWEKANIKGKVHQPVHNITVAPRIQKMALINLCLSSQQLGNAVSLRAYEVPASGGFLLTDWKADLERLFAPDEIVTFRSVDEMNDKIAYYEKNPDKRLPIIRKARERVAKTHLVLHRVQKMLEILPKTEWA